MKGIQALRERRDALAKNLQTLVDKEKPPKWEPEHQTQYDQAMTEISAIDAEIKRHNDALTVIAAGAGNGDISDDIRNQFTRTPGAHGADTGLRSYLGGGLQALEPTQLNAMRARQSRPQWHSPRPQCPPLPHQRVDTRLPPNISRNSPSR